MENQKIINENSTPKKGVVRKIVDDLKESTHNIHEINKANIKAEHELSKKRHAEATAPNPDFEKFKKAKGLKAKTKVVAENIKKDAKNNTEKEKVRRQEIKEHTAYKNLLEEQRSKRKNIK